jgi:hypothetical protein
VGEREKVINAERPKFTEGAEKGNRARWTDFKEARIGRDPSAPDGRSG